MFIKGTSLIRKLKTKMRDPEYYQDPAFINFGSGYFFFAGFSRFLNKPQ